MIGLEVHVELATASKMFCGCPANHFGKEPNTQTCPVCLGLPGALPVPNKKAIDWTILIGLAFNCTINPQTKFDRKNYFYPDLPKGYQISQYDLPIAENGYLEMENGKIGIKRIHIEEDTGKLQHEKIAGENSTLIDFNRSGVPLVEIVTDPDIKSAAQAKVFLQEVQQILRVLKVSDCDMEKGSMRLEANVSVRKAESSKLPRYKVELKNINSFRFLEKGINFEVLRQTDLLKRGKIPPQETRGFRENTGETVSQRSKEEANDYRYFPEPDIPPLVIGPTQVRQIKSTLPSLPQATRSRLVGLGLPKDTSAQLAANPSYLKLFNQALDLTKPEEISAKEISNYLVNKRFGDKLPETGKELVDLILLSKTGSTLDQAAIKRVVTEVVFQNPQPVADFKAGKTQAKYFLVGLVRTQLKEVDVKLVTKFLDEILNPN